MCSTHAIHKRNFSEIKKLVEFYSSDTSWFHDPVSALLFIACSQAILFIFCGFKTWFLSPAILQVFTPRSQTKKETIRLAASASSNDELLN